MGLKRLLTILGLGAGAMYLFDPEQGNRRRAMLRDRWTSMAHDTQDLWRDGIDDLQNRARGMRHQAESVVNDTVQQATGAAQQAAGSLQQAAVGGINRTVQPGMGNGQVLMAPGPRLLAIAGGSLLTLYGSTQRGLKGGILTAAGLNFLTKGIAHKSIPQMIRRSPASALRINKSIMVNAPLEEVYGYWKNYENFPKFMSHIKEVQDLGDGRSHWVAEGPVGVPVEWDARITADEPNRVLAWESLPESSVYNFGQVKFQDMGPNRTQINVHMSYSPPGGTIGHAIAEMFGADPKTAMDEDLVRLKSLFEHGKTTTNAREVTREQANFGRQADQGNQEQAGPDMQGGQGRMDEVGRTGVYPASGPMMEGDAEVRTMGQWGSTEVDPDSEDLREPGPFEPSPRKPGASMGDESTTSLSQTGDE